MKPAWTRSAAALLGAAALWLACTAGLRALTVPDEGRYVGVAWDMLNAGQWGVPTLAGLPFFHKPPLFYWITAAALGVFGAHEWAARLASVLGALLALAAVHGFARRWMSAAVARWSVVALATTPFFFIAAQFANMDMLVAGCITATTAALATAVLEARRVAPAAAARALLLAYACAALGVLAKGLIGAVLPALVITAWLASMRDWRGLVALLRGPGPLLALAIAAPWFAAMQWRYPGFFDYFVMTQHVRRFAGSGFNNVRPFWFYLPVIALLALPWAATGVVAWRGLRGAALASGPSAPAVVPQAVPQDLQVRRLLWLWAAVVVLFFSLPRSKLIGYVLPALPPLALLVVDALHRRFADPAARQRVLGRVAGVSALVCLVSAVLLAQHQGRSARPLAEAIAAADGAHDPVVFVDTYRYDLGFYNGRAVPTRVVADWQSSEIDAHDNWLKEVHDGARFEPAAAADRLIGRDQFAALLCRGTRTWVIAPSDTPQRLAVLQGLAPVVRQGDDALWHVELDAAQRAARCAAHAGGSVPAGDGANAQ